MKCIILCILYYFGGSKKKLDIFITKLNKNHSTSCHVIDAKNLSMTWCLINKQCWVRCVSGSSQLFYCYLLLSLNWGTAIALHKHNIIYLDFVIRIAVARVWLLCVCGRDGWERPARRYNMDAQEPHPGLELPSMDCILGMCRQSTFIATPTIYI